MIVKLFGYGILNYLRDPYNIFDALVIIFSTIEVVIQMQDEMMTLLVSSPDNVRKIFLIFRPFRFLRIFKIARKWKSLNQIFSKLSNSVMQMLNFMILLLVFIFIFSLLGMELFSNTVKFNKEGIPIFCNETVDFIKIDECLSQGKSLRLNFDNLQNALQAVFVIIVGDDWNSIMYDYVRATNYATIFFFVVLTIIGNIILMTLFLAIMLREFDNVDSLRDENMVNSIKFIQISSRIKH